MLEFDLLLTELYNRILISKMYTSLKKDLVYLKDYDAVAQESQLYSISGLFSPWTELKLEGGGEDKAALKPGGWII